MGSALNNHFDGDSPAMAGTSDGSWISTYSRGLCSMYHNDEDHCWEAILHAQQSPDAFSTLADDSAQQPTLQGNNRRHGPHPHHTHVHHNHLHGQQQQNQTDFSDIGMEPTSKDDHYNDPALEEADVGARLVPTSPGSGLSQALCNIGFNCIDFVTGDNVGSEPVSARSDYFSSSPSHAHDSTLDSTHTLAAAREDGLEADSTILEDKKGSSSWARRVWRAL
ncbi:hypothetical protein BKA57DRAFT_446915 [Linnemannia elongata]|nr:hypothetical protein BGZ91_002266 [Linnemannia elongata]KAG0061181.1 hypothetical protein BGZ89_011681 [Linnemannia elongata]KAG0067354.1 hypothetical protein BGZ90_001024 [Linnemannia elongata]KAH7060328.1 hypothetical protein BKA57DRAFT_446915 [Linnemannia elongata]KAK5829454.1 hypothetical protein F5H01DRAFT_361335 [Linnemannia elongata]